MNAELLTRVAELRDLREKAVEYAVDLKAKQIDFAAENAALVLNVKASANAVAAAETAIKAIALAAYESDKVQKPAPGVEIKLFDVLEYDAALAFAWAKDKKMALVPESLDVEAFKKIAAASPTSFDFVSLTIDPRVQIATNLDKALASVAATAEASV